MKESLKPGLVGELTITVTPDMGVKFSAEGAPSVYATPWMIAHMERTCSNILRQHLDQGEESVGIAVNVKHLAAAPVGAKVTHRATLVSVDGRRCTFNVEAYDERQKIGEGMHERFIIDVRKFADRLRQKM